MVFVHSKWKDHQLHLVVTIYSVLIVLQLHLQYSKECPFCRHPINIKDINVIVNSGSTINSDKGDRLPTKIEKLREIISDKSKRFMIFSEYDACTFNEISEKLDKDQIKYSLLKGSSGRINNIISKFTIYYFIIGILMYCFLIQKISALDLIQTITKQNY